MMPSTLFLKTKTKNLTWNHEINNVLFSSKKNKQNIIQNNLTDIGFIYNSIIKHTKNASMFTLVKILILCLNKQNNNTYKLLFGISSQRASTFGKSNINLNIFILRTFLTFLKNTESQILYSHRKPEHVENITPIFNKLFDSWSSLPHNMILNRQKNLTVLHNIKQYKKLLTKRVLNNFFFQYENSTFTLTTLNGLNVYQHDETKDQILHMQQFNQNHLKTPLKYLYLIYILETKIEALSSETIKTEKIKSLIQFYNFLYYLIEKKQKHYFVEKQIIGQNDLLSKIKGIAPDIFIQFLSARFKKQKNISIAWNQPLNIKNEINFGIKTRPSNSRLNFAKIFIGKKLEIQNKYFNRANTTKVLNTVLNANVRIFYINALAFAKFGFLLEKQKGNTFLQNLSVNPSKFLNNLDREMISKYKYIGVYIKDLIRVCFIALFFKKPAFLAKFIAFQISVLPKNRRETSFVRFLIKVVKTLAAEREEILGLRLKFKGRVNRWRRTKVISGQRGILPLHTINNRIEYGTAQAINRKGALGIHIWIWYNPLFKNTLKETYLEYFKYSNHLNTHTKH